MKSIYRLEIQRAFKNKRMVISLAIGMFIAVYHIVAWMPMMQFLNEMALESPNNCPMSAYLQWIGGNRYTWHTYFYYLILPILATIPYGTTVFEDRKHGYSKNIILRTGRGPYYRAKFLAIFLSGGTAAVVPLIANFLMTMLYYPVVVRPEISTGFSFVEGNTMLHDLHFTHPLLYILVYLLITFAVAGLFANLSLIISRLTDYKFVVEMGALFCYIFAASVFELLSMKEYNPVYYLVTCNNQSNGYVVAGELAVLFCVTFGFVLLEGRNDEVL